MVAESIWVPGCSPAGSVPVRPTAGALLPDRRTERVLKPPGHSSGESFDVGFREGAAGRAQDEPERERFLPRSHLLAPVEVEQAERFELRTGGRADRSLDLGIRGRIRDHDGDVADGGRVAGGRGNPRGTSVPHPPGEVDLGHERRGRELPPLGDPRVELPRHEARRSILRERDRASGVKARRRNDLASWMLHAKKVREAAYESIEIVQVPGPFTHEPRLAVLRRFGVSREEDGRGDALLG